MNGTPLTIISLPQKAQAPNAKGLVQSQEGKAQTEIPLEGLQDLLGPKLTEDKQTSFQELFNKADGEEVLSNLKNSGESLDSRPIEQTLAGSNVVGLPQGPRIETFQQLNKATPAERLNSSTASQQGISLEALTENKVSARDGKLNDILGQNENKSKPLIRFSNQREILSKMKQMPKSKMAIAEVPKVAVLPKLNTELSNIFNSTNSDNRSNDLTTFKVLTSSPSNSFTQENTPLKGSNSILIDKNVELSIKDNNQSRFVARDKFDHTQALNHLNKVEDFKFLAKRPIAPSKINIHKMYSSNLQDNEQIITPLKRPLNESFMVLQKQTPQVGPQVAIDKIFNRAEMPKAKTEVINSPPIPQVPIINNNVNSNTNIMEASQLDSGVTTDTVQTDKIIEKVNNYINNLRVINKDSVNAKVMDKHLGNFNINVTKMPNNKIEVQLVNLNHQAHDFFLENQVKLSQSLAHSGINISDIKLEFDGQSNTSNSDKDFSTNSNSKQQNGDGGSKESKDQDSQRRRELWESFNEQKAS